MNDFRFPGGKLARAACALAAILMLQACGRESNGPEPSPTEERASPPVADLVFRGGAIYTVDAGRSWAEALAVRNGRIVFVGSDEAAADWIGPETRTVDLAGRMMLPGFQDAHVHPIEAGTEAMACDLNGGDSIEAYLALVERCANDRPDDPWILGYGWESPALGPGVRASRKLLDAIVPDRPVYLESSDAHIAWVNSRALELAGVSADTPDPKDGRIDRDPETGEAIGSLQEGAMDLVEAHIPVLSVEQRMAGLRYSLEILNALGITAIQDAHVDEQDLEAYARLDQAGELSLRVVAAQRWDRDRGVEQVAEMVDRRARFTHGRVNANSVKFMLDGVMENYTAAMLEPYRVEGSPKGIMRVEPDVLGAAVDALDAEGFQLHFHAIGDAAVREALDALEHARNLNPDSDGRHHIAHLEVIDPADIPRFGELGVVANFQPLWAFPDDFITELTIPFVGPERARWLYPIGSVIRSGGRVAFGSDWSVSTANPMPEIEVAVTRSDPDQPGEALFPEEAISLADAIAAFTINAAFVNHIDRETGSLEVGKAADLVVLDRNLFEIAPTEISEVTVVLTMLDGVPLHGNLPDP